MPPLPAVQTYASPLDNFLDAGRFNQMFRVASMFADSPLVPTFYQGKPASCMIALDLADRLQVHPLMLMQNTYEVGGRPGFMVDFLIALAIGRGEIADAPEYEVTGQGEGLKVVATAVKAKNGKTVKAEVTMAEAIADGWTKNQKYKSIPVHMLKKRAGGRLIGEHFPHLKFGFSSVEELMDGGPIDVTAYVVEEPTRPVSEASVAVWQQPVPAAEAPIFAAAPTEPAAPPPAAEAPAEPYVIYDAAGERVGAYVKAGVPAQKAIQAEMAKCRTVDELDTLLEFNEAVTTDMSEGCRGNITNSARARRAELMPAVEAPTPEAPIFAAAPTEPAAPPTAAEAPEVDESLRVAPPRKPDGSLDYAPALVRLKTAIATLDPAMVDPWIAANQAVLDDFKVKMPTWAKTLSDAIAARRKATS